IVVNSRNGPVVAVRTIKGDESLLLITKAGMVTRIPSAQLRSQGRSTQGVTLMDVAEGDVVGQVAVLPAEEGEGDDVPNGAPPSPPSPPPSAPTSPLN
ncbi:MAG: gyrase subunit, partial [Thermoplasmata archaeon]|nr:gyrase subunit [Thermoplasmata archaeon]